MPVAMNTFWSNLGVVSGNLTATNQYDLWKGITFNDGFVCASQYDFFTHLGTNRYEFFKSYNSVDSNIVDETTFYQNTDNPNIWDYKTFYENAAQYLVPATSPTPTPSNTATPTLTPTPSSTPTPRTVLWAASNLNGGIEGYSISPSATTWTVASVNTSSANTINTMAYNGSIWAGAGTVNTGTTTNISFYSNNGYSWLTGTTFNPAFYSSTPRLETNGSIWLLGGNSTYTQITTSGFTNIGYSYDGINYSAGTITVQPGMSYPSGINCFGYDGNIWLAGCSSTGTTSQRTGIIVSNDGINWTGRTNSFFSGNVSNIIYANGKWAAAQSFGSSNNKFATSVDGINWTGSTIITSGALLGNNNISGLVYFKGKYVVSTNTTGATTYTIVYSYDGLSFSAATSTKPLIPSGVRTLATDGNVLVATSATGATGNVGETYISNDGINWSANTGSNFNTVFTGTSQVSNIISNVKTQPNPNPTPTPTTTPSNTPTGTPTGTPTPTPSSTPVPLFVAGGSGTTNKLAYSPDGLIWSASTNGNSIISTTAYSVAWNGSMWVAAGSGTNTLAYSYDGLTWSGSTNGNSIISGLVQSVAWNGTIWVAGGNGTNFLAYSNDGLTWSASTNGNSIFTASVQSVAWNGSMWIAAGSGTNVLAYSNDGLTWSGSTNGNSIFTTIGYSVAWNGSMWVAGGLGTNTLAYSNDGLTWSASTNGNSIMNNGAYSVAWNGSMWVAAGSGTNRLAYSNDGITWSASTNGNSIFTAGGFGTPSVYDVIWNGTKWVAVGASNPSGFSTSPAIAYSTDGLTWSAATNTSSVFGTNGGVYSIGSKPSPNLYPPR
jgi:hypothetical protein